MCGRNGLYLVVGSFKRIFWRIFLDLDLGFSIVEGGSIVIEVVFRFFLKVKINR